MRPIAAFLFSSLIFSIALAQQGKQPAAIPAQPAAAKSVSNEQKAAAATPAQPATPKSASSEQQAAAATPANSLGLTVGRTVFAKGLDENGPIDPGTEFSTDVKRLYCITQIKGAKDTVRIEHRWYVNDKLVFTLPLPIMSVNWRTQSYISIRPEMIGNVKVEVVLMPKEEMLTTMACTVK